MTRDDFIKVIESMNRYWHKPAIPPEELRAYQESLKPLNATLEDALNAVKMLSEDPSYHTWRPRPGALKCAIKAQRIPTRVNLAPVEEGHRCTNCDGTSWVSVDDDPHRKFVERCLDCSGTGRTDDSNLYTAEDFAANARKWVPILKVQLNQGGLKRMDRP